MTLSDHSSTDTRSRRALIIGALGGIGAWAASAVGRATPVRGANNDPVLVGTAHTGTATTRITNSANTQTVLWGQSTLGTGVYGSGGQRGVLASTGSDGIGLEAVNHGTNQPASIGKAIGDGTGVLGYSGPHPAASAKPKTGVYGHAVQDSGSRGVWGRSNAGQGVRGQATSGAGLFGTATTGYALRTNGRLRADKVSGVTTIPAGSTGVTVSPGVNVTSASFVLLTPKTNIGSRGLWFTTNASADTFRIRISSSRGSATKVAWLLMG